jgi:hypothetical protein
MLSPGQKVKVTEKMKRIYGFLGNVGTVVRDAGGFRGILVEFPETTGYANAPSTFRKRHEFSEHELEKIG